MQRRFLLWAAVALVTVATGAWLYAGGLTALGAKTAPGSSEPTPPPAATAEASPTPSPLVGPQETTLGRVLRAWQQMDSFEATVNLTASRDGAIATTRARLWKGGLTTR